MQRTIGPSSQVPRGTGMASQTVEIVCSHRLAAKALSSLWLEGGYLFAY